MNRLTIVLAACGIHLCIGSVYAWSVLTNPIAKLTGWQLSEITFTFSLAILFLGFSAGCLGNYVQKWGARKSSFISCLCFVTGLLGSAFAIHIQSLLLLYFFYGCIGGIGLGVGYIAPVATLLKWFPTARGFAGGCAVMSFGFSAMLAGPLMQFLIDNYGVENNLIIVALLYAIIMSISASKIKPAPKIFNINADKMPVSTKKGMKDFVTKKAMHTREFIILWIVFFINIACGIALLSILSPMAENIGMDAVEAAGMVGIIGMINGGGRIFFASISDYLGRGFVYALFFVIEMLSFFWLSYADNPFLFQSIVFVIVACYGGGFSCMPAYLSDLFGTRWISAIHGRILTAWGVAGIVGPMIITFIYEKYNTYTYSLRLFSALFLISFILISYMIKRNEQRMIR